MKIRHGFLWFFQPDYTILFRVCVRIVISKNTFQPPFDRSIVWPPLYMLDCILASISTLLHFSSFVITIRVFLSLYVYVFIVVFFVIIIIIIKYSFERKLCWLSKWVSGGNRVMGNISDINDIEWVLKNYWMVGK